MLLQFVFITLFFLYFSFFLLFIPHSLSVSDFLPLTISLFFFPSISNCQFILFPTLLPYFSPTLFHFYRIEFIDVDERAGPWSVECRESFRWLFYYMRIRRCYIYDMCYDILNYRCIYTILFNIWIMILYISCYI